MADWNTRAGFDAFYSSHAERWGRPGARPPVILNYHWFPIVRWQEAYAQRIIDTLGLNAGDGVVLVGCGWNGTGKGLSDRGIRVIGTEISSYIQNEKGNTEEAEIRAACVAAGVDPDADAVLGPLGPVNPLDLWLEGGRAAPVPRGRGTITEEEMRVRGSRNSVLNAFSAQFPTASVRFILTEEVLNGITDAQALLVCDYAAAAAREWGATVVHMLSPLQTQLVQIADGNWKTYAGWRAFLDSNGFAAQQILPTVTATGQGMTFPIDNGVLTRVRAYSGVF